MPSLKDINCSVELAGTYEKLHEYGVSYSDGVVEAFIPVPTIPKPFTVHLTTSGYVAPGLAMFVYIDGVYQCNRNRQGLIIPDGTRPIDRTLVDFRVRQKEETRSSGKFVGREWSFEKLNVVSADEAPDIPPDVLYAVGTIEVIVLRCTGDVFADSPDQLPRLSKPAPVDPAPKGKKAVTTTKKVPPAKSDTSSSIGGLFGLFDGACDTPPRSYQFLDGSGDDWGPSYDSRRGSRSGKSSSHSPHSPLDIPDTYSPEWRHESNDELSDKISTLVSNLRSRHHSPEDARRRRPSTQDQHDEASWVDERPHPKYFRHSRQTHAYEPSDEVSGSRESQRRLRARPAKVPGDYPSSESDSASVVIAASRRKSAATSHSSKSRDSRGRGTASSNDRRSSGHWGSTKNGGGSQEDPWEIDDDQLSPKGRHASGGWGSTRNSKDQSKDDPWDTDKNDDSAKDRPASGRWGNTKKSKGGSKNDPWEADDDQDSWASDSTIKASAQKSRRSRRKSRDDPDMKQIMEELKALRKLTEKDPKFKEVSWSPSTSSRTSRRTSRTTTKKTNDDGDGWGADKSEDEDKKAKAQDLHSTIQQLMKQLEGLGQGTGKNAKGKTDGWGTEEANESWGEARKSKDDDNKSDTSWGKEKTSGWGDDTAKVKDESSADQGWGSGKTADADDSWGDSSKKDKKKKEEVDPWGSGGDNGGGSGWGAGTDATQKETGGDTDGWGIQETQPEEDKNDDGWATGGDDQAKTDNDDGWGSNDNQDNANTGWGSTENQESKEDDANKDGDGWGAGGNDQGATTGWGNEDEKTGSANGDKPESNSGGWNNDAGNTSWGNDAGNTGWGNDAGNTGWGNEDNNEKAASQAGDAWGTGDNDKKSSSRRSDSKSTHKSSHHSSSRKPSSYLAPPSTSPRPYWSTWNAKKPTPRDDFTDTYSDLSARPPKAKKVYLEPEEPLPKIPSSHAKKEALDHQVRAGKGSEYHHRIGRPEYMDPLEKPYAVFRFKYRSRDALKKILGKDVLDDDLDEMLVETTNEGDLRDKLLNMSKEEMVEAMLRMRSSSGMTKQSGRSEKKSESHKTRSHHSGSQKAASVADWGKNDDNKDAGNGGGWGDDTPAATGGGGGGDWNSGAPAPTGGW